MKPARISAIHDGRLEPLFDAALGVPSPSPMLLIEAHRGQPGDWRTRTIPGQVLTLFLEPASVLHSIDDAAPSRISISSQSVVFSLRGQPESVLWLDAARVLAVQIDDRVLADAAATLFEAPDFELLPSPGVQDVRLSSLLQALHAEQSSGYTAGRLFVDSIEQALAACLVSQHGTRAPKPRLWMGGMPPSRAKRLVDYIHAHIDSPLQLDELAACVGYSPSHFSRIFHESFGTSPHRFVLDLRTERAKEMLARRDHSILDVAQLCGFQTQQHFSRVFRQRAGMSPGKFRRSR